MYVVRGPVVNSIYTAIRYLTSVFSSEPGKRLRQAVLIDMSASAGKQIGYMIWSDFSEFPDLHYAEGQVSVYRSFSYQIGGGVTGIMPYLWSTVGFACGGCHTVCGFSRHHRSCKLSIAAGEAYQF